MSKGFADNSQTVKVKRKVLGNERMFSWSPWPPANFQTKYPAFPLVMTLFILLIGKLYITSVT